MSLATATYAPRKELAEPHLLEWSDAGGRHLTLSKLTTGDLDVSAAGFNGMQDDNKSWCTFRVAKPDVPDFLLLLQTWIEQL